MKCLSYKRRSFNTPLPGDFVSLLNWKITLPVFISAVLSQYNDVGMEIVFIQGVNLNSPSLTY